MFRALTAVGVATLALAAAAPATPPQAVTLTFTMTATGATTATGTWTATGSLTGLAGKSGTVAQTIKITGKGKGKGKKAGQVVHGTKNVTASDGTFVIKFVGQLKSTGATTSQINGRFVIKKGTGAYQGLHGTGKIAATLNTATGAISASYTGKAHVDHA